MKKLLAWVLLSVSVEALAVPVLSEGFDDVTTLPGKGWVQTNNSFPLGTSGWFQGLPAAGGFFDAQAGAPEAYIAANFLNADFGGNISNWLISPVLTLGDGDTIEFYTRSNAVGIPDRLELRLSTNGASTDVGASDTSVGDFTTLLLTINQALDANGYPDDWALFSVTLSGLGSSVSGRFAFRYDVTDTSANADYIGIDTVLVSAEAPAPSSLALGALALGLLGYVRRRGQRA